MGRLRRTAMAAALAVTLLSLAVTAAHANYLNFNETGFRTTWREVSFIPAFGGNITCALTLEGSFHSATFPKTAGSVMASVRRQTLTGCTGGEARALTETLPWQLRYTSFGGTLPNMTSLTTDLTGAAYSGHPTEFEACLLRSEARRPIPITFTRRSGAELTTPRFNEASTIPLTGGGFCSLSTVRIRGTGNVTKLATSEELRLFLEGPAFAIQDENERTSWDNIILTEPVTIGQKAFTNINDNEDYSHFSVSKNGARAGLFDVLTGASEDCSRAGFILLRRFLNSCTVRILYRGRPEERQSEMNVIVTSRLGANLLPIQGIFSVVAP